MTQKRLLSYISKETGLSAAPIQITLSLFESGATIPFIARYRKEKTNGLDETQLRHIQTRYDYYLSLFSRQETVIKTIEEQGKLTPELKDEIQQSRNKQSLEDLYLPFKKRRKTKADIAVDNGLGPLATIVLTQQSSSNQRDILAPFIDPAGPIPTEEAALEGASHIVAQSVSDSANYREWIRSLMMKSGQILTRATTKFKNEKTKFEMYYNFSEPLKSAAPHRLLAIRRGEKEKVLNWKINLDDDYVLEYLYSKMVRNQEFCLIDVLKSAIKEGYSKGLRPSIQTECFSASCEDAERASIDVFSKNLENLLMAAPAPGNVIMGIDPGFRTGCKIAIVDKTGTYKATATIFPGPPVPKIHHAEKTVLEMVKKYDVYLIAIGNGTGSKETMQFIRSLIKDHKLNVVPVVVNESGASVYSASELAIQEFPDLDITVRGAISIARRLQDPLAELVKLDPKSIGVGQYQHDVNQGKLKEALTFTTELAVNAVGVDLNTASHSLLSYISGIGPTLAQNIVKYRENNGRFKDRKALLKVGKLGPKAYQQCVGFLRIKEAINPLDDSAIHPEAYAIVKKMAAELGCPIARLIGNAAEINQLHLSNFVSEDIGLPTLKDIVSELLKPGLDPRAEFVYATFDDAISEMADLKEGMKLEGVVTNVTNFGAFVDIGVHQDGLIHISKLSNTFVKNPQEVISVGERVNVTVIGLDMDLKRIQLEKVL